MLLERRRGVNGRHADGVTISFRARVTGTAAPLALTCRLPLSSTCREVPARGLARGD